MAKGKKWLREKQLGTIENVLLRKLRKMRLVITRGTTPSGATNNGLSLPQTYLRITNQPVVAAHQIFVIDHNLVIIIGFPETPFNVL
jgi:hypothetical protein